MALIVTPGQFSQRAELYHQLAQLTSAGIGLVPALGQVQRHPPARSFREPLARVSRKLGGEKAVTVVIDDGQRLPGSM